LNKRIRYNKTPQDIAGFFYYSPVKEEIKFICLWNWFFKTSKAANKMMKLLQHKRIRLNERTLSFQRSYNAQWDRFTSFGMEINDIQMRPWYIPA
jgi:hypothetical protein